MARDKKDDKTKKQKKETAPTKDLERVFKVVYEHNSYMYPVYIFIGIVFLTVSTISIVLEVVFHIPYAWTGLLLNAFLFIPYYIRKARKNRFIITNKRFIRDLKHPKKVAMDIPLKEIIYVKYLSRSTDKYGLVQIRTSPEFGEQILIDGDTEYGVITCFKVDNHVGLSQTLMDVAELARKGLSFDFEIHEGKKEKAKEEAEKKTKSKDKKKTDEATGTKQPAETIPVVPLEEITLPDEEPTIVETPPRSGFSTQKEESVVPKPEPTIAAAPTPEPTPEPVIIPAPEPEPVVQTNVPEPEPIRVATPTPEPTPEPEITIKVTPTPIPEPTLKPEPVVQPGVPEPEPTRVATPTPEPTPEPEITIKVTPTPVPTPTPTQIPEPAIDEEEDPFAALTDSDPFGGSDDDDDPFKSLDDDDPFK